MALRLTPYLARSNGSSFRETGLRDAGLPILAFGTVTALLLTVAGGSQVFWSWSDDIAGTYQGLAVVAMVLLIIPLLTLGASAARLAARRHDDRLASLRLLGANSATVVWMTVIESTVLAAVGALAGAGLYACMAPFLGLIQFRGQAIGSHAWLSVPSILGCVLAVCVLAAASAALGLRKVVVTPLGVRTRQTADGAHWVRGLIAAVVVVVGVVAMGMLSSFGAFIVIIAVMGGCFGLALLALNLMGPWILRLRASSQLKRAKRPEQLLAARTVLESPKESWRQVGGVAMTSFVGVFVGVGMAVADTMGTGADAEATLLVRDINTGVMITLLGSFLMVACSAGVNQAAAVLDRASTLVALDRVGMPRKLMVAARVKAVMSPLFLVAGISAAAAAVLVLPLTGAALLTQPVVILTIGGVFAAGFLLVRLAVAAGTAQIGQVLARPERYASMDS
ncbi:permease [Paenarthrobacter nitroguajacolicus]|uniref:FtsX-like permease family protein n=1 Tax=Paenarthrobacter nitroguajacolicus TaxID=211146 RepID=UPI0015C18542|nr:permease [Paenarthrobacter nitroguajacolicus]